MLVRTPLAPRHSTTTVVSLEKLFACTTTTKKKLEQKLTSLLVEGRPHAHVAVVGPDAVGVVAGGRGGGTVGVRAAGDGVLVHRRKLLVRLRALCVDGREGILLGIVLIRSDLSLRACARHGFVCCLGVLFITLHGPPTVRRNYNKHVLLKRWLRNPIPNSSPYRRPSSTPIP